MSDTTMAKFPDCKEAVKDLAERQSIQKPKEGDIDALQTFKEVIPGASILTLEFPVVSGWTIHIEEIFIDYALNVDYVAVVRGQRFEGDNFFPFSVPQKEVDQVIIKITNFNAAPVTLSGRIKAWASTR